MSMLSEQVKYLRNFECFGTVKRAMGEAADTIEALSAKLSAANMERSENWHRLHKIIGELEWEADKANNSILEFAGSKGDYYDGKEDGIRLAIEIIKPLTENTERYYGGGWILVKDRFPAKDGIYYVTYSIKNGRKVEINTGIFIFESAQNEFPTHETIKVLAWYPLPTPPYHPNEDTANVTEKKAD